MNVEELMMKLYLLGWEREQNTADTEMVVYLPPERLKKGLRYVTFNPKEDNEGIIETNDERYSNDLHWCSKSYADIAATLDREGFND